MAKEIYLYSGIYDFTAQETIESLEENMGTPVEMRVCSGGGGVFPGWGICGKISEHGDVTIKVDGLAASMATALCLFAKSVECIDVTRFMFHRANMYLREGDVEGQRLLDAVNKDMRTKMKAKLNSEAFKEISGYSIDEMFDAEDVVDVWMDAKQAKRIGLVKRINKIEPAEANALNQIMYKVAASMKVENKTEETSKSTNMTLAELKEKFSALYNEIFALGVTEGTKAELERVNAALTFADVDMAGVKAVIESGKPMTQKQIIDFTLKSVSAGSLKKIEEEGKTTKGETTAISTKEKTEKEKENESFLSDVLKEAGVTGKKNTAVKYSKVELN